MEKKKSKNTAPSASNPPKTGRTEFFYGLSFAGEYYYMMLNGKPMQIGLTSEDEAEKMARHMLGELGIEVDEIKFQRKKTDED